MRRRLVMRRCHAVLWLGLFTAGCEVVDATNLDAGDVSGQLDNPCPNGVVMVDFPCTSEFECIDQVRYQPFRTLECADLGFDPRCCGGGQCEWLPQADCAADELCVSEFSDDRCAKKDCGGALAPSCPSGQFCERPYGVCDGAGSEGVCLDRTDECGFGGADECAWAGCDWECGCNGSTYGSRCERYRDGVARFALGPCCNPGKVTFDRDNVVAFVGWEACATIPNQEPGRLAMVLDDLASIDSSATCTMGGPGSTCSPSEVACRGALAFESGATRITAASFDVACRVAGLPYVRSVAGRGGPACSGELSPVPVCGQRCADPCGCESCRFDDRRCDDNDPLVFHSCRKGCWEAIDCQEGLRCAVLSGTASCWPDCDMLLEWWGTGGGTGYRGCSRDEDCRVIRGGCQVGLPGGCWDAVNVVVDDLEAEALLRQWQGMNCGGTICTCDGPKPVPACTGGICTVPAA